jgi:hypothetical protein
MWQDVGVPEDELEIRGYEAADGTRTVDASALAAMPDPARSAAQRILLALPLHPTDGS